MCRNWYEHLRFPCRFTNPVVSAESSQTESSARDHLSESIFRTELWLVDRECDLTNPPVGSVTVAVLPSALVEIQLDDTTEAGDGRMEPDCGYVEYDTEITSPSIEADYRRR